MNDKKKEILEAMRFRRAVKAFDPEKKVSKEDFEFILEVGRLSPSSFGWEPWTFIVVDDAALKDKIAPFCWGAQGQLPTASHFMLLLARKSFDLSPHSNYLKYKSEVIDGIPDEIYQMKMKFYEGFVNNEFDLTDDRKMFDWACRQVYLPLGNMMTAAAQLGIDSCPMEGFDSKKLEAVLVEEGIIDTKHFGVASMLAFGYRSNASSHPQTRFPLEDIVIWV